MKTEAQTGAMLPQPRNPGGHQKLREAGRAIPRSLSGGHVWYTLLSDLWSWERMNFCCFKLSILCQFVWWPQGMNILTLLFVKCDKPS